MKMLLKAGRFRGRTLNQTGLQSGGGVWGVGRRRDGGGQAAFQLVSGEEGQRPPGGRTTSSTQPRPWRKN